MPSTEPKRLGTSRRQQRYKPGPRAHEFTKVLYAQMLAEGISEKELCERARIARRTLYRWKMGTAVPDLASLERALRVFDLELRVKPIPLKKLGRTPMFKKEQRNGKND